MALSNSQYERFMRMYEERQLENNDRLNRRYEEVYRAVPEFRELEDQISAISVGQARRYLDGDEAAIGQLKEKLNYLFTEKKRLLKEAGFPEDYLTEQYTCPDCKDTGYRDGEKCHCFKKAIIEFQYTQSNLQEVLKTENFEHLSMDYYSRGHIDPLTRRSSYEAMQKAVECAHEFVDAFAEKKGNLLLYGDTGVGKTFLSHCIAKELLDRTWSVIYFTASELFDVIARKQFERDEDARGDLELIYDCDLLIIDDLGTEYPNGFSVSQFFVLLNERMLRKKSVIISTNLSLEELKEIYSERVFSRISSMYTVLRMTGDDIRLQKKLMGR